jgi:hypothetical protein
MTKAKEAKAPRCKTTELDRIATQLRTMLRRDTTSVIEKGKLLLRSRELLADERWQKWLAKNFDLSYRTAHRYVSAAKYVAAKSDTVSHFANLSPTVLYRLAEGGHFDERVEAAILAEARKRRVDEDAMWAICDALAPPDDADDQEAGDDDTEAAVTEDPEITAIVDGPPPAVPPPAPIPPPTDFALRDFDQAVSTLKRLMTKRAAQFAGSAHSGNDLENVASFIQAASDPEMHAITAERAEHTVDGEPQTVAAAGTHSSRSRHANPRREYVAFLKSLSPEEIREELVLLRTAIIHLECGCTISVESPDEVTRDSG